jgi:hypothetical protein
MNRVTESARAAPRGTAVDWVAVAFRWLAFALVATQLVFAHGCHGDGDHELFTSAVAAFNRDGDLSVGAATVRERSWNATPSAP